MHVQSIADPSAGTYPSPAAHIASSMHRRYPLGIAWRSPPPHSTVQLHRKQIIAMSTTPRHFATIAFAAIAVFMVIYTWLPARDGLQRAEARVSNIVSQPNTWYEVEIMTSTGIRISCRTRRGWPLFGPNRCPLEKFEHLQGRSIAVLHDGKRPYEVTAGSEQIIDYSAHRKAQIVAFVLAVLMMGMAAFVWSRK